MRSFPCLALLLVACHGSSKETPALSASSGEPVVAAPAPAPASAPAPAPSPSEPDGGACIDTWRAHVNGWLGAGGDRFTLECKDGKATLTSSTQSAHVEEGDEIEPASTYALTRDEWNALWKEIEATRWRDFKADCSDAAGQEVDNDYMDADLEISDGTTTKKVSCGFKMSARYKQIIDVLEHASTKAAERAANANVHRT